MKTISIFGRQVSATGAPAAFATAVMRRTISLFRSPGPFRAPCKKSLDWLVETPFFRESELDSGVVPGVSGQATDGPDFICIGMGKSGTGWLYDQLLYHPDFWMPPIKELHYLNREDPKFKSARYLSRRRGADGEIPRRQGRPAFRARDIAFLEETRDAGRHKMDLEFYARIFRFKGGQMSGDVTPSYCAMPDALIARIMARFPHLKIILLVRDPVARALSHLAMRHRAEKLDKAILDDIDKFRSYFETSRAARTGSPAASARQWLKHVPQERFRYYLFEDLQTDPEGVKRQVIEFLGGDPNKESALNPATNRKIKPKTDISEEVTAFLAQAFADELIACGEMFGSHAKGWAAKYGIAGA